MSATQDTAPILVPVDFSADSAEALAWAAKLSACSGAALLVLHVVHDLYQAPGYYLRALKQAGIAPNDESLVQLDRAAAELMIEFLTRVAAEHPQLGPPETVPTLIVSGVPATRILEVAEREHARHIVMGRQGRTRLEQMMLGSKAETVVRGARVPVTILKATAPGDDA